MPRMPISEPVINWSAFKALDEIGQQWNPHDETETANSFSLTGLQNYMIDMHSGRIFFVLLLLTKSQWNLVSSALLLPSTVNVSNQHPCLKIWRATLPRSGHASHIEGALNGELKNELDGNAHTVLKTSASEKAMAPRERSFFIRDCTYAELGQVAEVIVRSFYTHSKNPSPWIQLYRMGELNRLQQNFPYADKERHRMLVACVDMSGGEEDMSLRKAQRSHVARITNDLIVGFCDIDARISNRPTSYKYNPRPYLSDLCIDPDHRRMGIAKALVQHVEVFCVDTLDQNELYIRVEKKNVPALSMYQSMGYHYHRNPIDSETEIILLRKDFDVAPTQ